MKRLLFISSRPLYPIVGGDQIRTVQFLNLLSQHFSIDVLCIIPSNDTINPKNINEHIRDYYSFKIGKIQHIILCLRFIFNKLPIQVNYYYSPKIKKFIESKSFEYDAIFCNNIRTAEYVMEIEGVIKYIDFVDAISMNYDKARKKSKSFRKLIYTIDFKRCRDYEKYVLNHFDSCSVISEVDKQYILK